MRKVIIVLLSVFLLTACQGAKEQVQEQTGNNTASMNSFDDSYYKIIETDGSQLREDFYLSYGASNDFQTVGRGLQILSSDYFSVSGHYMSEGQYLTLDLMNQMLSRKSEYCIQPPAGTTIENVVDPTMVQTIQEQDYYVRNGNSYTLKGVSFALVIEPRDKANRALTTSMSKSSIESYGKEVISKFYNVIQKAEEFEKIKDLPILICVYRATDKVSSTTDGNFILKSYCQGSVGEIIKVNHEVVLFTSSRAEEIDKTTYADFNVIKASLKDAAIEAAGLVGEARYVDGEIQSMLIQAHLNVKTSTELMFLTSWIADGIDSKFTYDFDVKVLVSSQDELQAIIIKEKGQKAKSYDLY